MSLITCIQLLLLIYVNYLEHNNIHWFIRYIISLVVLVLNIDVLIVDRIRISSKCLYVIRFKKPLTILHLVIQAMFIVRPSYAFIL